METYRFSSRAKAEEFLRGQGFRFWQTAPECWRKPDGQTNLYGDIEDNATGTVVVVNPGSAVSEIVEERQRRHEQRAPIGAWDDDGGNQRPVRPSTAAQPRLMRWRRPCLVEA